MTGADATGRRVAAVHGWLIIDKPSGTTSARVVSAVRRATGAAKAGHGGTLDPLATGVLPIALGEATKTMAYVVDGEKSYRFTVRWGESRSTDDIEGEVTARCDLRPDEVAIRRQLPRYLGDIEQIPPTYSAIKVGATGLRPGALPTAGDPATASGHHRPHRAGGNARRRPCRLRGRRAQGRLHAGDRP